MVDDTGFPKDGEASPCVARQYSGTLGKTGNCQIGVSVHLVNERASCAADWRLYCPAGWDDEALEDPVQAARAASCRARAGIPDDVRHAEKWRLALEMLDEMTGPEGWDVLGQAIAAGGARPVVAADAGYGDNTTFLHGPGEPGLAVRGRGQGHHQRPRRGRAAGGPQAGAPGPAGRASPLTPPRR